MPQTERKLLPKILRAKINVYTIQDASLEYITELLKNRDVSQRLIYCYHGHL